MKELKGELKHYSEATNVPVYNIITNLLIS